MSSSASLALAKKMKGMVEREVKKQLKELMKEHVLLSKDEYRLLMERAKTPVVFEGVEEQVEQDPFAMAQAAVEAHRRNASTPQQKRQVPTHGVRTGNSTLDSILQETKGGITGEYAPFESMGHFDSSTTHLVGMRQPASVPGKQIPLQTVGLETGKTLDINSDVGQSVASALTRNYSDVLNAVKKKKGF